MKMAVSHVSELATRDNILVCLVVTLATAIITATRSGDWWRTVQAPSPLLANTLSSFMADDDTRLSEVVKEWRQAGTWRRCRWRRQRVEDNVVDDYAELHLETLANTRSMPVATARHTFNYTRRNGDAQLLTHSGIANIDVIRQSLRHLAAVGVAISAMSLHTLLELRIIVTP